jgi:hypothetical protein
MGHKGSKLWSGSWLVFPSYECHLITRMESLSKNNLASLDSRRINNRIGSGLAPLEVSIVRAF